MSLLELTRLAMSRLATSRVRSALTMLGIIIGVASVVALVAVGQGASTGITDRITSLGTNLLTINAGATVSGGVRQAAGSATTLTLEDAAAVGTIDGVAAVSPELSTSATVVAADKNTTTTILGTTEAYPTVRAYSLWQGSFLTDTSVEQSLRVAVLGSTTADDLGLGASAIGTDVSIGGIPFQVVGILQTKGSSGFQSGDDQVLIPVSTLKRYFTGSSSSGVRSIGVSVATAGQMPAAKAAITSLLEERHDIASGGTDDFTVADQTQLLSTATSVFGLLTVLLAGVASISLVVGGIGIMNIMLVSVRERTREIGIRKAIGAKHRDILLQFLVEALVLSILGGLIGIVVGLVASAVIGAIAGWGFTFNPLTLVAATLFSLVVGVLFGVWPARQAARLNPIAALRFE
ncbi:MAG TPA: ABC transporter permease [Candidatus Limnocylindrales bacterium]